MARLLIRLTLGSLLVTGCGPGPTTLDSGTDDRDASLFDAGAVFRDAGLLDAGEDGGTPDSGSTIDAGMADAGNADAGNTADGGVTADAGTADAGAPDSGVADSGLALDAGPDAGEPDTTFTGGPGPVSGPNPVFGFTSNRPATFECQLVPVEASFSSCSSPKTYGPLPEDMTPPAYSFRVRARDDAGVVDGTPATLDFLVDATGPTVVISGTPSSGQTTSSAAASLSFSTGPETPPITYECRFNGSGFASCQGFSRTDLIEGLQTLEVRARDGAGNVGPTVTRTWTIQPLLTTILNARSLPIPLGTRVRLSNTANELRVTGRMIDRFWVQEVNGTTSSTISRGITVLSSVSSPLLVAGRSVTVTGTLSDVNGNLSLAQPTVTFGALMPPYQPRSSLRSATNLLLEANEGMLTDVAGRVSTTASPACANYDFCIVSCEAPTPLIFSIDAITSGTVTIGADANLQGVLEGAGAGFRYVVLQGQEAADACL